MSEEKTSPYNRMLTALVAGLALVAAVEGYYLVQGHYQADAGKTYAAETQTSGGEQCFPAPDKALGNPPGTSLNKPFNAKSWNPFQEMTAMQEQMDHLFNQAFGRFNASPQFNGLLNGFSFSPQSDIEENDHEYIVRLDIPGIDSSQITATIEDRTLTVSGTREEEASQQEGNKPLSSERSIGKFERVLTLPGPVKQDELKATYKDGVLTITIPKDTAVSQSRTIKIQ